MNKRILKRSLAVLLASVGVSVDMNTRAVKIYDSAPRTGCLAMKGTKNTKIISMKDYVDKDGKVIPTAVPQAKEANWFKLSKELKTPSEMLNFLETHKKEIFYVTMTEGKDVRRKTAIEAGRRIFKFWTEAINKKRKKEAEEAKKAGKKYEKKLIPTTWRAYGDEKLNDLGKGGRWSDLGRTLRRKLYNTNKIYNSPSNLVKGEIEAAQQGVINCTVWSTFTNWFLNMNGIPSRKLWLEGHECVCVPLRDEKNPDAIRLYRIEINENVNSVEEIEFLIEPLTTGFNGQKMDPWNFMAWYKKEQGWGVSYYTSTSTHGIVSPVSKNTYAINPTMAYLELIEEGIRKKGDKQYPLEAIDGYVKGLQLELKKLKQSENDVVDDLRGVCTYKVRYIPKDKTGYKIPINIEHLGKAIEIGQGFRKKRTFTDRYMKNKTTDLITAKFNFTSREIFEENAIDKYRDGNWRLSITAPRKAASKKDGMDKLEGLLFNKKTNEKKSLTATVEGLPEKINDVSAYWNRPDFKQEVGRQMVKSIKDD